jgi:hypothetical protein
MMLNPIEKRLFTLVQTSCVQTFDFSAGAPECGRAAAFLIKSILRRNIQSSRSPIY